MLELYVDADACPVKEEVLTVAGRHALKVFLVSNQWMRMAVGPNVEKVVVPDTFDAADDWIADHVGQFDIVITADIPLAARCLESGAAVLGPTGKAFTADNIGMAVAMREVHNDLRQMGETPGYNAPFSRKDRSRFLSALEEVVQACKRSQGTPGS